MYSCGGSNRSAKNVEEMPGNQSSRIRRADTIAMSTATKACRVEEGVDVVVLVGTISEEPRVLEQWIAAVVHDSCRRTRCLNVCRVIAVGVYELVIAGFALMYPPDLAFEDVILHSLSSTFHCSAVNDPFVKISAI